MKGPNASTRAILVFCLVVFSLFLSGRAAPEETTVAAPPDVNEVPANSPVDQAQSFQATQPDATETPVTSPSEQTPATRTRQPEVIPQYILIIGKTGNGQGKVTNSPAGHIFKKGIQVILQAVPEDNSVFTGWSGSCSGSSRTCSLNMTTDRSVIALFSLKTYTIRAPSPVNGVIHPSGTVKVNHGEKRRFQVIPLPGFRVFEVLVDKVSVGAVKSYTFNTVTADHLIEAIFVKE